MRRASCLNSPFQRRRSVGKAWPDSSRRISVVCRGGGPPPESVSERPVLKARGVEALRQRCVESLCRKRVLGEDLSGAAAAALRREARMAKGPRTAELDGRSTASAEAICAGASVDERYFLSSAHHTWFSFLRKAGGLLLQASANSSASFFGGCSLLPNLHRSPRELCAANALLRRCGQSTEAVVALEIACPSLFSL